MSRKPFEPPVLPCRTRLQHYRCELPHGHTGPHEYVISERVVSWQDGDKTPVEFER